MNKFCSIFCCILVPGISSLFATEADVSECCPESGASCSNDIVSVCDNVPACLPKLKPDLIELSHTEGKGLGYSKGYSSLDLFLSQPFCQKQCAFFLDLRGHIFNDGKYAANAGFGFRWLDKCHNQIWGINSFYDYLQTEQRPFNQVSMGFEALWETWGVFVNGYLPVGKKETPLYQFSYLDISPTGFLLKGKEKFAMKGVDAEVGYRFCNVKCVNLYAGIGPYYYWGRSAATENAFRPTHRHAFGGRLNASVSYRNYVSLEGIATYDSLFKWGGQVTLAVAFPFDFTVKTKGCGGPPCLQERLYQPVRMNEIIVIDRIHRYSSDPDILNPENEP
ncbi:MAG TPA: inverse autotransporter beta domain-containing protein [Rhabdochlamydiaceae bacterium]|nr:inverse autotransporter beta domain-containing protein [Rhabdochlamydiaceae bacterium]